MPSTRARPPSCCGGVAARNRRDRAEYAYWSSRCGTRARQSQPAPEHVGLDADLGGGCSAPEQGSEPALRLSLSVPKLGRRVERDAVRGVNAHVGATDETRRRRAQLNMRRRAAEHRRGRGIVRAEAVVANRAEQFEILVELDLVEAIDGEVGRGRGVRHAPSGLHTAIRRIDRIPQAGATTQIGGLIAQSATAKPSRTNLVAGFTRSLKPDRKRVLQPAGPELTGQVSLVDQHGVVGVGQEVLATDGHKIDGIARRHVCRIVGLLQHPRRCHQRRAIDADVARGVANLQVLVEVVLEPRRGDVGIGQHPIGQGAAGDAEPVAARNRHRRRRLAVAVIARIVQRAGRGAIGRRRQIGMAVVRHATSP